MLESGPARPSGEYREQSDWGKTFLGKRGQREKGGGHPVTEEKRRGTPQEGTKVREEKKREGEIASCAEREPARPDLDSSTGGNVFSTQVAQSHHAIS